MQESYYELRGEKDRIWKDGNWFEKITNRVDYFGKNEIKKLIELFNRKRNDIGRYESNVKKLFYNQ